MSKETERTATQVVKDKLDWNEVSMGGVIEGAGNSVNYQTGDWRSERPVIEFSRCIHCMFCWVYCPDGAMLAQNQKLVGVDYFHCKGCGICSVECPTKCIEMVDESTALGAESEAAREDNGREAR